MVSAPYIEMTIQLMKQFGITVQKITKTLYKVPKGIYSNPKEFTVESDASSASYPLAMAAITGGRVTVSNLGSNSLQGDSQFCKLLQQMGCIIEQTESSTTVQGRVDGELDAVDVDMSSMTDTFMTASVLAALAKGTTKITNIANQRVKESNRIAAMVTELTKCGIKCSELPDGIQIEGNKAADLHDAHIHCYNDHRIAMSFAVLGCRIPGIIITDKECVDKTYPDFWISIEKNFQLQIESPDDDNIEIQFNSSTSTSPAKPIKLTQKKSVVLLGKL